MDFPELVNQTRALWYTNNPIDMAVALNNLVTFLETNPNVCERDGRPVDMVDGEMVNNLRNFIIGLAEEALMREDVPSNAKSVARTLEFMLGF